MCVRFDSLQLRCQNENQHDYVSDHSSLLEKSGLLTPGEGAQLLHLEFSLEVQVWFG